jgi:hypothetical protein
MRNRIFFPQEALDNWVAEDRVDFSGDELTIREESRKYRVVEAVCVLREVTDGADPNDIVGKVKTRAYVTELGAELMDTSLIIGENAYDIVPGFIGSPVGSFDEHRKSQPNIPALTASATSDEELLAALLGR